MDRARFYTIVMSKNKAELQNLALALGQQAWLLMQDIVIVGEDGEALPKEQQKDEQVINILKSLEL